MAFISKLKEIGKTLFSNAELKQAFQDDGQAIEDEISDLRSGGNQDVHAKIVHTDVVRSSAGDLNLVQVIMNAATNLAASIAAGATANLQTIGQAVFRLYNNSVTLFEVSATSGLSGLVRRSMNRFTYLPLKRIEEITGASAILGAIYSGTATASTRASQTTQINPLTGDIEMVANNVPALAQFSDGDIGIQLMPAKTNVLLSSEDFTYSAWNKRGAVTALLSAVAAPRAGEFMTLLSGLGAAGVNDMYLPLGAVGAGIAFSNSIWMMQATSVTGIIYLVNRSSNNDGAYAIDTSKLSPTKAERMVVGHPAVTELTAFVGGASGIDNFWLYSDGTATDVYIFGAQAELGRLTPYIPTVTLGVAPTRLADTGIALTPDNLPTLDFNKDFVIGLKYQSAVPPSSGVNVNIFNVGGTTSLIIRHGTSFNALILGYLGPNNASSPSSREMLVDTAQTIYLRNLNGQFSIWSGGEKLTADKASTEITGTATSIVFGSGDLEGIIGGATIIAGAVSDMEMGALS